MGFQKGKSGNPEGRKPGSTAATKLREAIAKDAPSILKALTIAALNGDTPAAKVLLDRVVPALKPQALPVSINSEPGLVAKGDAVIDSTLNGTIPPDIGAALITALANQAKLIELEELNKRMERIESLIEGRK